MPPHRRTRNPRVGGSPNNGRGQGGPLRAFANLVAEAVQDRTPVEGNQPRNHVANFKDFKVVGPPEFRGSTDPIGAQNWIEEIEKVFEVTRVADDQKTAFATFMMKGEANYWWKAHKDRAGEGHVTWICFKELFFENYFPECMKTQMEVEFLELKQGEMTVAEYTAKFNELSRFAPHQVDTEERKAKRFELGLKPRIFSQVAVLNLKTFASLLERAIIVERGTETSTKFNQEQEWNRGRGEIKDLNGVDPNPNKRKRIGSIGMEGKLRQSKNKMERCPNCGRNHQGRCFKSTSTCYRCGQEGHVAANCSISKKSQKCFACDSAKHHVRDCPKKGNKERISKKDTITS